MLRMAITALEKIQAAAAGITAACAKQIESGQPAAISFGEYGGALKYSNQPFADGLLFNKPIIEAFECLKHKPKQRTIKQAFLLAEEQCTWAKLNASKYTNDNWASWCAASVMLAFEHLWRLKANSRVYGQVTQRLSPERKSMLDNLVQKAARIGQVEAALVESPPKVKVKTEEEVDTYQPPEAADPNVVPHDVMPARTDYTNFAGGITLKMCLVPLAPVKPKPVKPKPVKAKPTPKNPNAMMTEKQKNSEGGSCKGFPCPAKEW